jgi:PAS domain S-box-containing protein
LDSAPLVQLREEYNALQKEIAQRRQAEEALRESEELHRITLLNISDAVFLTDDGGDFTFICPNVDVIFGYSQQETQALSRINRLLGEDLYNPADLAAAGELRNLEREITNKSGARRALLVHVKRVSIKDGTVLYVCRDVTERKRAEEALRRDEEALRSTEEMLRELVETTSAVPWQADAETGQFTYVGRQAVKLFGYPIEVWYRPSAWSEMIHPEDRAWVQEFCRTTSTSSQHFAFDYRMQSAAGETVWVQDIVNVVADNGHPRLLRGFLIDISERKRAEEALQQSEERYRDIVEDQTELICRFLPDGTLTFVNGAYCRYFQRSADELVGGTFWPLIPPQAHAATRQILGGITPEQPVAVNEHLVHAPKGELRWQQWTNRGIFDERGRVLEYQAVGRDVTERRQAEAALQQSEERYRDIVEDQTELICRFLADGTLTFVNDAYCRYFRRTAAELVGGTFWPLIPSEAHEASRQFLARITPDHPVASIEHPVLLPDGEVRWQQWTDRAILDDRGSILEYQAVGRDVTERKRAEEALVAAHEEIRQLKDRLHADNIYLQQEIKLKYNYDEIIGQSAAIRKVLRQVEQVAATRATVLLMGETGTGKELLARAIHSRSPRHSRPMVTLNCAALPATLVESELFGREKGAYTGALTRQMGRFELADGSTLFLDEIGDLPLDVQVKLLRLLQEGQFERLGSTHTQTADVRILAATNLDLGQKVAEGDFREDLFYRLNVFPIRVPPLRDRPEDVPLLVWGFVQEFGRSMGKVIERIPRSTMEALQCYSWPGNIRELRNVVERAVIVAEGPALEIELPPRPGAPAEQPAQDLTLDEAQRRHILGVLRRTGWRVSGAGGAAEVLGLKPTTLESRMSKLGIRRRDAAPDISGDSQPVGNGPSRPTP